MAKAPPGQPRLYLNEHLSPTLASVLRQQGYDVISCLDIGMDKEDDDIQLAYAVANQRAVVTVNHKDFAPLHEHYLVGGSEHWGIILTTEERFKVYLRRMLKLLNSVSADDLRNQTRWLNEFK